MDCILRHSTHDRNATGTVVSLCSGSLIMGRSSVAFTQSGESSSTVSRPGEVELWSLQSSPELMERKSPIVIAALRGSGLA